MLLGLVSSFASSAPEWSKYRVLNDESRAVIDGAVTNVTTKIHAKGFVTKEIRYCAREKNIWETSINASCKSTEAAAVKYTWPPVLTNEGVNFDWMAYMRLVNAYCASRGIQESCKVLTTHETPPKKSARFLFIELFFPFARAEDACKVSDNVMLTKTGKKIFLDFGVHPAEQHADLLEKIGIMAGDEKKSEGGIRDGLSQLKNIGQAIVKNYKTKSPWVLERMKVDHITWIGTEQSSKELGGRDGADYAAKFDAQKTKFIRRQATKEMADDAMTSGACPSASACVWLQEKSARTGVKLVALESDELKNKTLQTQKDLKVIYEDLDKLVESGKITKDELGLIKREYTNMVGVITLDDPKVRKKERDAASRRYGNPDVANAVAEFYDISVAYKQSLKDRGQAMAEAALAQNSNGILGDGEPRRASMILALESACRGPADATIVPLAKPSKARVKQ